MASSGIQNYVNTVIFCVVMKIICILMLGAMLLGYINESIVYFLITLEIGIVAIVIAALWNISSYEKRLAKETKNLLNSKMTLLTCPDFHTQTDKNMCVANYTTADGKFTYSFAGSNVSLGNYLNKPIAEACQNMTKEVSFTDPGKATVYLYPWTDLETKCDII